VGLCRSIVGVDTENVDIDLVCTDRRESIDERVG